MKTIKNLLLLTFLPAFSFAQITEINSPLPTSAQVEWQKQETTAFVHFGQNTFSDVEWGYGDALPSNFNPTNLDVEQWVRTFKAGGIKCVIITAKHHDGFCLWPSKYTDYSIASSPYKNGKGDLVKELSDACRKYGLKFGVYLSPWDRHQAFYGRQIYVDYYMNQMTELLTNYGEITEVWLDGANGGDGYYGGAKEKRNIDRRAYYNYPKIFALIHKLQPNAIIFSDGGPDCRWTGNEDGVAGETNWSFLRAEEVYPGYPNADELNIGHVDGTKWMASECDVSIRPGWFYHANEDSKVKTSKELRNLYLKNVGRNGLFLLNVPPNKEGRISQIDSLSLVGFHKLITDMFANNLLTDAKIKASSCESKELKAENITDTDYDTYWSPEQNDKVPELNITCKKSITTDMFVLQEYIPKGQHVAKFVVQYQNNSGKWVSIHVKEKTTTIGYKRILTFKTVTAKKFRIVFNESRGPIYINNVGAYNADLN